MDWDLTLGGDFPTKFWQMFSGTLNNFMGVTQTGPYNNQANGVLPFLILIVGLMFVSRVIRMIRRITSDSSVSGGFGDGSSVGFRNE